MDELEDDPFKYSNIEIPTVVGLLRNILTQYPDNGQILKELVQNAEDAGASSFEVLYDKRNFRCNNNHLERFVEGPALCAYNNAEFTDADWHGIRKLCESIKRDDPVKVGKFGLGFKSVFHFTDYVTVISGHNALFMDPCEEAGSRMCRELSLLKLSSQLSVEECLHVGGSFLKKDHLIHGHFPGTIFWFPLRKQESKLSATLYLQESVERLFTSFSVEASSCLIFLKSLESICIKKVSDDNELINILQVNLSSSAWHETQEKKKAFREMIQSCGGFSSDPLLCKYDINIITYRGDLVDSQQQYRILQYIPAASEAELLSPPAERNIPLVGIAAPMVSDGRGCEGQIFCFLPLPLDPSNNTKLPIQINGSFALDQNRRHVKWKTEECSSEGDVEWNENLVITVVADAYFRLLEDLLKDTTNTSVPRETWYSVLPNIEETHGRWKELAVSIWRRICNLPIIHSEVRNEMMLPRDVVYADHLDTLSQPVADTVKEVLTHFNVPLATLPSNVLASLCQIDAEPKKLTPKFIRQYLKNNTEAKWKRLHLLEYVLSDGDYDDLDGIHLLPLKDGSWKPFCKNEEAIYICSKDEGHALLGIQDRLLKDDLPPPILEELKKIASKGVTQLLRFCARDHTSELLPKSVEYVQNQSLSHHDMEKWLQKVWSLLQHVSLQKVEMLALLPSTQRLKPSSLINLSSAFVVEDHEGQVSKTASEALDILDIKVLPKLPSYIQHLELARYLHKPYGEGISQVLENLLSSEKMDVLANKFNSQRTDEQRLEFCSIVNEARNMKTEVKCFLKKLQLFKALDGDYLIDVSTAAVQKLFPLVSDFPVGSPETLIKPCEPFMQHLALKLDAQQLTKEELCILALRHERYSEKDIQKLGWYVLQDIAILKNKIVFSLLSNLKFISTSTGKLCSAGQLYDPKDTDVEALLGEDLIPDETYWEYLSVLRNLGLKKVQDMPREELVGIVTEVQNTKSQDFELSLKVKSLLSAINRRIDCSQICNEIKNVPFVFGERPRPTNYPSSLFWATEEVLYKPSSVKNFQLFKDIVGSTIPLVNCEDVPNVANCFGWNKDLSVDDIISHMKNIVTVCPSPNGVPESVYFEMTKNMYRHMTKIVDSCAFPEVSLKSLSEVPCVITSNGFKLPSQVFIPSGRRNLPLEPYIYSLPLELCEYDSLFTLLGTFRTQTPQVLMNVLKDIQNVHCTETSVDIDHDLKIVISVLEQLQNDNSEIDIKQLLLPVETSEDKLKLVEIDKCAYSDQNCDWLDCEELGVKVVHSSVPKKLAIALGVQPLKKHLLADEEAVMEWGQVEPLTTRLHNLLRQYRDGIAVLKELVQNADDAGATEISLLYDERYNQGSAQRLITEQFSECQGPALWAYNNAKFTETDLENLCKLGGGTKELQSTKIGKFGLGFCAVYNITDVPSLVTGSNYIIFDPHRKYLEDKKHGVKYNFSKPMNQIMLKKLNGQFQPFHNIFGCQVQDCFSFEGTLFRFPFRTVDQAKLSEISRISYDHEEVIDLLKMFREVVGEILLFTQNIKEVKVFHLSRNSPPENMELLYKSSRIVRESLTLSGDMFSNSNQCCKQVESVARLVDDNHKWNGGVFQESVVSDISVVSTPKCKWLLNSEENTWTVTWLTSWHSGRGEAFNLSQNIGGKVLSLGAVAVPIEEIDDLWNPRSLESLPCGFYKESHMHCFLPLPVKTPFPVQINGFFEVASDRTSLQTRTVDDRSAVDWNSVLISDAVNAAYICLIDTLRIQGLCQECKYFSLWPVPKSATDALAKNLVTSFYGKVKEEDLIIFHNRKGWHPLTKCCFLADNFHNITDIGDIALEFMEELLPIRNKQAVVLPEMFIDGFGKDGVGSVITEECFYTEYFLPNISLEVLDHEKRDKLLLHVMDTNKSFLEILKDIPCIPTMPNGILKKPGDLVDPGSKLGELYTISDERFPADVFLQGNRCSVLVSLGMKRLKLDTEMVLERSKTVNDMSCIICAVTRSSRILHYIDRNREQMADISKCVIDIPFIPVMPRPDEWIIRWKGDSCSPKECIPCHDHATESINCFSFASPSSVCSAKVLKLCGSNTLIHGYINEDKYSSLQAVYKALGIITKMEELPFQSVISQLREYCSNSDAVKHQLKDVCFEIYKYFNNKAKQSSPDISSLGVLRNEKILLTSYGLMEPSRFSMDEAFDCSPALFSVKREGLMHFEDFMKALGIEEHISAECVHQLLLNKTEEFHESELPEKEIQLISNLLNLLFLVKSTDDDSVLQDLSLPNARGILCPVTELCIDDGVTVDVNNFNFLHPKISYTQEILRWLGIEEKTRKRFLELSRRLEFRMEFGQKEPLTTRLKNILDNYPCDSGVMKELLQNADDAGASEIAFIKDFRTHSSEKLFDEKWAPLQGPALCVYNNKCFNERDLKGIQNLGESCKVEDPTTTGQYGIGFNAVYHITDAPSFFTRGEDVPENETLCLFDPLCKYDPYATSISPGVQLTNLDYLRKEYPDSFSGYLGEIFEGECTVFRLPLRHEGSEIGKEMNQWKLKKLLKEFESEMKIALLFLRSVRKMSICSMSETGELVTEYCVHSQITEEEKVLDLKELASCRKMKNDCSNISYFFNKEMVSYRMTVTDTENANFEWLLVHQFGSVDSDSLPELIKDAYYDNRCRMLPQAGVALLLSPGKDVVTEFFKVFCFLPLPSQSGLKFCVNGHFALDSSRRNLWTTGKGSFKVEWNNWLLKEVLVPAAVESVNEYRRLLFKEGKSEYLVEEYKKEIECFYEILPNVKLATTAQWKQFIYWFYQEINEQELQMFDVYIPEDDEKLKAKGIIDSMLSMFGTKSVVHQPIKGRLSWHALKESGKYFPLYFSKNGEEACIVNTLKRLGMKIGSSYICQILLEAKVDIAVLDNENALTFLSSWNCDLADRCHPVIMSNIDNTPFLNVRNVSKMIRYISSAESFYSKVNHLPLLVTGDLVLKSFDEETPAFLTGYSHLLPEFKQEFLHSELFSVVDTLKLSESNVNVVKPFTIDDLATRLPEVLGGTHRLQDVELQPEERNGSHGIQWITNIWKFITDDLSYRYSGNNGSNVEVVDWKGAKQSLLETLGDWALYPMTFKNTDYVIPIQNASRILNVKSDESSIFAELPLPHPCLKIYLSSNLNLTTTLRDPGAVLDILYDNRKEIHSFTTDEKSVDFTEVLEYFGKHCENAKLSKEKLRAMQIFKSVKGRICSLETDFIILTSSASWLGCIETVATKINVTVLKTPSSEKISILYKYLKPKCMMCNLDVFSKLLLPNLSLLPESGYSEPLSFLREELIKLVYKEEKDWSEKEKEVVSVLKVTPFIMKNGQLLTANKFYDPFQPVFAVMKPSDLPDKWKKSAWRNFLQLAGMIHKLAGDMFVSFAQSLSIRDEHVKEKSKVLVDYLSANHEELVLWISVIKQIEFLVPERNEGLQSIFPYFETPTGLLSFSGSVSSKFAYLLWTTVGVIPSYVPSTLQRKLLSFFDKVPQEKLLLHVKNISSVSHENSKLLEKVMECMYEHLEKEDTHFIQRFARESTAVVHLPDKKKFVTVDMVVQNLTREIEPYLFKAPLRYGKYFSLFSRLGVSQNATCDHYVYVLSKIHVRCKDGGPDPEESRCMKLALEELTGNMRDLKNITAEALYLPTKDKRLVKSTDMYVSDNYEYEKKLCSKLDKPLFVGLKSLKIFKNDTEFVQNLPLRLKPLFLSEVVTPVFDEAALELVDSPEVKMITNFINSEDFQQGVIRVLNHYQLRSGSCLNEVQVQEVTSKLASVKVIALKEIRLSLKMQGDEVGTKAGKYYVKSELNHDSKRIILYVVAKIRAIFIYQGLFETYKSLFSIESPEMSADFMGIFSLMAEPEQIDEYLNDKNIKNFGEECHEIRLYQTEVGTYLDIEFIHLLDNEFCRFHKGEIVAMKKYMSEDSDSEDDCLFIIVQVKCQVKSSDAVMFDEYEILTGSSENPTIVVKAHRLYKFVRKNIDVPCANKKSSNTVNQDVVPFNLHNQENIEEELNEAEIMKNIRMQMKEIWQKAAETERTSLLYRLLLIWHPDKNMHRIDLCTRITQYILSLRERLENGESIPDDEDHTTANGTSSDSYRNNFRPPPWFFRNKGSWSPPSRNRSSYHNRNSNRSSDFSFRGRKRTKMADRPEARRWWQQGQYDLDEAKKLCEKSSCWTVFMCYQAAEKALKAALYLEDCTLALKVHSGTDTHRLSVIASYLTSKDMTSLALEIQSRAGLYNNMQYPSGLRVPYDVYTEDDASFMLNKTEALFQEIQQIWNLRNE